MKNEKTFIPKIKRLTLHFKKSVSLSWRASPKYFILRISYELISIALPIISLYLSRSILNILSYGSVGASKHNFYMFIAFVVLLQLLGSLLNRFNTYISGLHNDLVGNQIDLEIVGKINELDISYFDNPKFYDEMQNAMRDSRSLQSLTWISLSLIKSIVQVVTNFIILASLNIFLPFAMLLLCLPGILIDKYVAKRKYDWQLQRARNDRKLGYIKNILHSKNTAKDIRLFGVQNYFKEKFISLWGIWFGEKKKLDQQRMVLSFSASVLPYFATTAVLIFVGNGIFNSSLTIGDYSLYGGISNQLLSSITTLAGVINQSYESEMRLSKYADFLKLDPIVKDEGKKAMNTIESIEFRNVSFKYPKTERIILDNVSFRIETNKSLALVGLNGAGKSTIVKLLLRLYDPDEGEILINGINLKEFSIGSYYKCIGVVFQDFCRYNLTLREVIALTDITKADDDERIFKACRQADLDVRLIESENALDRYLGKVFDPDGAELSGGNWQKIAIAQAYFKDASLMVFDEPNAALDPIAERNLFEKMANLSKDKCVVYVTHRLSSATTANKIIVISNGVCAEEGTHEQLMEKHGIYYELFSKQAEQYQSNHGSLSNV